MPPADKPLCNHVLHCPLGRAVVTALVVAVSSANLATSAEFIPLGFPIDWNIYISTVSVSEDGSVVAGSDGGGPLYRWTRSSGLRVVLGSNYFTVSMSGDGSTIAASREAAGSVEAIKITDTGIEVLPSLPNVTRSEARLISKDGSTVVGFTGTFSEPTWFRWTDQGVSPLPDIGYPDAISADGTVLVSDVKRWSADSGVQNFPVSRGADRGGAFGISSNGQWAVGRIAFQPGTTHSIATRWNGLSAPEFLPPDDESWGSVGLDVTADGSLIVGGLYPTDDSSTWQAGVWTEGSGWVTLHDLLVTKHGLGEILEGWQLTGVYDVTDDGRFMVGHAFNPDGVEEAFYVDLQPIPEPTTAALALLALVPLAVWRMRRGLGGDA